MARSDQESPFHLRPVQAPAPTLAADASIPVPPVTTPLAAPPAAAPGGLPSFAAAEAIPAPLLTAARLGDPIVGERALTAEIPLGLTATRAPVGPSPLPPPLPSPSTRTNDEEQALLHVLRLVDRTLGPGTLSPVERAFIEGARVMFDHLAKICKEMLDRNFAESRADPSEPARSKSAPVKVSTPGGSRKAAKASKPEEDPPG